MAKKKESFISQIPQLNLDESRDLLTDFSREAQRHLISARNSLLVLETVASDKESIENVFKTFHTIKGLADFLNLHDIFCLTTETETMLDMVRKDLLHFEGDVGLLTTKAINNLQSLLELLDNQIEHGGKITKESYLDIGPLINDLKKLTSQKIASQASFTKTPKSKPTIVFKPDMTVCSRIAKSLESPDTMVTIEKDTLAQLINDFEKTGKELKDVQSKLAERQRELIKERELAIKLTQQAQNEARVKSEYLANMSHEIRTLINAILGFTDLLKEGSLNRKQKEHVNTIILSGKMLLEIVNHILDFSKVESGKIKLENVDFNLDYIIEDVFKIIRTRLVKKPINLYFDIKDTVPRNLVGDPTRLKQIFLNLLDNAIKFTEKGEIGLNVHVHKTPKNIDEPHELLFIVKDTGIGIPEDRKNAIFESFTQAQDSTTRLYGGSGLGLALCKTFVETMGGKIWVESSLGKGSKFQFTVKLLEGSVQPKESSTIEGYQGTHIMIIDDNASSTKPLVELCKKLELNVLPITNNAQKAMDLLIKLEEKNKSLPNIIFIDTSLDNKEGFMLAHKIKRQERYKNIKLVAISTNVEVNATDDFKKAGFHHFLARPIIKGEVMDVINRLLGEKLPKGRILSSDMLHKISCEGIRILVVEDSAPNQELLRVHFESLGCKCDYMQNGQEAIEILKKNEYDICFMDLQMPVMGGLEATKIIRNELKNNIPIVALTAAEFQEEKDRCYEVGMTDYLAKPFGADQLKEKIIRSTKM